MSEINNLGQLLQQANQLQREEQLDEAIALYYQVIKINPNLAWVYNNLGDALAKKGNLDGAIAYYYKSLEINPNSAWLLYRLGTSLAEQGKLDKAIEYIEQAIKIKPNHYKLYNSLGWLLTQKQNFDEAKIAYASAANLNPNLSELQSSLGILNQVLAIQKYLKNNQNQKSLKNNIFYSSSISFNDPTIQLSHQRIWDILAQNKDPVLVVGMHNSGTSILAEILHKSGIFMGADMDHYESSFFSILMNNNLIMGGGSNWAKIPIMDTEEVKKNKNKVEYYIKNFWILNYIPCGYNLGSAWGFKDPRLCVLLPLYLDIFPKATVIHIRRNPNDIAASLCNKEKLGVGQINDFDYWKTLTLQSVDRVLDYANNCHAYYELNYEDLCFNTEETVLKLF